MSDRKFRTIPLGSKREIPAKVVEVFNPLFVVEEKLETGDWIPTTVVFKDMGEARANLAETSTNLRIALYKRVSENG